MRLTWHSIHEPRAQSLDSFSSGGAFLHRVGPAGGLPHPQAKWAHWQLTDPHPQHPNPPFSLPHPSPRKVHGHPHSGRSQRHSPKKQKRQNKRRLLFGENLQPSNTSIVSFMVFSHPLTPFVGQNVVEVTKEISQRSSLRVISSKILVPKEQR